MAGSWDGQIRLWAVNPNLRSFAPASISSIPINGFVNSMQFISLDSGSIDLAEPSGKQDIILAAAVSQEPRLGRWMRQRDSVKNGALVVHLPLVA